jgi:hypothetical protein
MLEVCGLLSILQTSESEEEAIASVIGPSSSELYLNRARLPLRIPVAGTFAGFGGGVSPRIDCAPAERLIRTAPT